MRNRDIEPWTARFTALLHAVAESQRPCKRCGEMCFCVKARDGSRFVLNHDATHHRDTCPRRPLRAPVSGGEQPAMFPHDPMAAFDPAPKRR